MSEDYVRVVVRAALEDLIGARLAHGVNSEAYRMQLDRSLGWVRGSLEEVTAARRGLDHQEGARDGRDRTTETG